MCPHELSEFGVRRERQRRRIVITCYSNEKCPFERELGMCLTCHHCRVIPVGNLEKEK